MRGPTVYVNLFRTSRGDRDRNWDSDRRLEETESNGIVAEVLFPNTIPPFFAQSNLTALEPNEADYEHRWAGVQAHNRWLADFCAAAPCAARRLAQVFLNDLDDTLAEVRWAKDNMHVFGGVLLPNVAAQLGAAAAVGSALRTAVGAVRGARRRVQHPRGERPARLRRPRTRRGRSC